MVTKKTRRNGIGGSLLLVSLLYVLPILIATGATSMEQADWIDGSMAAAADEIGGRWLGNWIVLASGIALLAEFISIMAALGISVSSLANRGQFPPIFRTMNQHNVPTVSKVIR
jgi:amino acid transporter